MTNRSREIAFSAPVSPPHAPQGEVRCPNCSAPRAGATWPCGVCGYRPERAREYFWLYIGGAAFMVLGFLLGGAGVLLDEVGSGHWSRAYRWFPFFPWPESYHWLGVLIAGITLSVGGLGLTRHFRSAWWLLVAFVVHELVLAAAATMGMLGDGARGGPAFAVASLIGLGLLARLALALRRTPSRNVAALQEEARRAEETLRGADAPRDEEPTTTRAEPR